MKRLIAITFTLIAFTSSGQEKQLKFKLLRQDDTLPFRRDSVLGSPYPKVKFIPFGDRSSLSFGGSYRFQAESFINEQFSREMDQNDVWFLNRFMLHAHLKLGNEFEWFAELNSSTLWSKENLSPVDKDELSINQLFLRYHLTDAWNILVGRQNLRLGSGRLMDIREGPNVRLSFDMVQIQFSNNNTSVTSFFAVPVRQNPGVFDNDELNTAEYLAAIYFTQKWTKKFNTDLYVLYKNEDNKSWGPGTADDMRVSLGFRHFGEWKGLQYNNEFVYQFGSFSTERISAWTASFNLKKSVSWLNQPITLGLKTEAISGDQAAEDRKLNTFDALYPRGAYFGRVARFGPSNLIDVHPSLETQFGPLTVSLDYVAFWRFSSNDAIYNPALVIEYPADNTTRFVGHQIGTITGLEMNKHFTLELETNVIFPGGFLSESGLNNTLFHGVVTAEFKF
ncbi:hypothetical protein FNH22_05800 [Fulvivirga sp. M361]|uniref:alginate export family protein n=1 Tax=Fulvivirga sp. M361 TaxID=2594266 RepID=UPI0011798F69|nr:alginate export family protein [Fulvivirga sp. M361]TRX60562.1 hypothetical protein FNH22_05800 [Fulvivirga sp. M361]